MNKKQNEEQVNNLKPLVNRAIMKLIPVTNFNDKYQINEFLKVKKNHNLLDDFIKKENIEDVYLIFMTLLCGVGENSIFHNEINLYDENFYEFKNIYDIAKRLGDIQQELGVEKPPITTSNIWLTSIVNNIYTPFVANGIGAHFSFLLEDEFSDYYDSLFKTMIKPEPPEEFSPESFEEYFNTEEKFGDDIERKTFESLIKEKYKILGESIRSATEKASKENFILLQEKNKDKVLTLTFSNEEMAKKMQLNDFWENAKTLSVKEYQNLKEIEKKEIKDMKEKTKQMFEKTYNYFKENPNIEPLKKKRMAVKFL